MNRLLGLSSSKKKSGIKEKGGAAVKEEAVFLSIFNWCSEIEVNKMFGVVKRKVEEEVETRAREKSRSVSPRYSSEI